jgi:uncharacterized protein
MKIVSREKSNTLLRTKVWTVQPDHIEYPFLVTVTQPAKRLPDAAVHGRLTLDGNYACGTAFQLVSFLEMSGHLPPAVQVSVGYVLDSTVPAMMARNTELTPVGWPEWDATYGEILGTPAPSSGRADRFLAFLNDELKSAVEAECGIDPTQWTLSGQSLGGLFALHALLSDPRRFRRYFAVGSSLWWRKPLIFDRAESFVRQVDPIGVSVYIAAGDQETPQSMVKAWGRCSTRRSGSATSASWAASPTSWPTRRAWPRCGDNAPAAAPPARSSPTRTTARRRSWR